MNSVKSNNLSFKYQLPDYKDKAIRKFEIMAKTQFVWGQVEWTSEFYACFLMKIYLFNPLCIDFQT